MFASQFSTYLESLPEPTDTVNPETEDLTTNKGESFELSLPLKVFPVNLINFQMVRVRKHRGFVIEIISQKMASTSQKRKQLQEYQKLSIVKRSFSVSVPLLKESSNPSIIFICVKQTILI